jgi:large subunit ribosomal protein L21
MFAVIKTGGKQYRVEQGSVIEIEKLPTKEGGDVLFKEVLLYDDGATAIVGTPTVPGVAVVGKVLEQKKGDKVIVFKYKRRKRYNKKQGHRQPITSVEITGITKGAAKKAPTKRAVAKKPATKKES